VKAQFTFLSGARAGQIDLLGKSYITVGRHPASHLRCDAEQDLDVSARHATIAFESGFFILRDLDSTNGTFVNGTRLTADHLLANDDVFQLGSKGPRIQFRMVRGSEPELQSGTNVYRPSADSEGGGSRAVPPGQALSEAELRALRTTSGNPYPEQAQARARPGPNTAVRVRVEVARQTRHLRGAMYSLGGLVFLLAGAALWQRYSSLRQMDRERRQLLGTVDSLMVQVSQVAATAQSLREVLDSSQANARRLRAEIDSARRTPAQLEALRRQLDEALRQQRNLSSAARLDAQAIAAANQDAVALIFVQFQDGSSYTGSAFAVRSDASGGLLLTNRHVLVDTAGNPPLKIGVAFNGSNQNFRAELLKVHPTADVALLRVLINRGVPTVAGLADSSMPVQVGEPLAMIGYPLGLDLPMGGDFAHAGVQASLTLGTASKVIPTLLQLDGYGAEGSSGSPVFNRDGKVVGILYGGQAGTNGRIVLSVPIKFGEELLEGR
jgi:S1-C subfamily serine protease